jgi:pilus assembly protein TadC
MLKAMCRISNGFPKLQIPWKGEKRLKLLVPGCDCKGYLSFSLAISFISAIIIYVFCNLSEIDFLLQIVLPLLSFAALAAFLLSLPEMEFRRRTSEMESALPFFLRNLGILLDLGIPFMRAMELSSDGEGPLQDEMRHVLSEVDRGVGLERALVDFAMTFDSQTIKRTVSQLISAYDIGSEGCEVRKMGDELLSLEQHRMKDYAARSSMFGLLFIMASAVGPTFFLVFGIAGRFAMAEPLDETKIAIGLLVVFPMASFLLLMLSKATMPRSAFSTNGGFDARMLAPGGILVLGFLFFPEYEAIAIGLAIITAIYMVASTFKAEQRLEDLEKCLPDALFSVSGMPRSTKTERIFEMIEKGGYGALSQEAKKSKAQLMMNVRLETVLDDLWARNGSLMLKRSCMMMKQMIDTNSLHRLNMLAEDITKAFQTMRERSQMFAMQKYTLLFGAILIPLIMKMTIGLLGSIGTLMDGDAGLGIAGGGSSLVSASSGTGGDIAAMVSLALSIVPPYLIIYSLIASSAIADAEGKRSQAAMYFLGMCATSLVIFHFINL